MPHLDGFLCRFRDVHLATIVFVEVDPEAGRAADFPAERNPERQAFLTFLFPEHLLLEYQGNLPGRRKLLVPVSRGFPF